MKLTRTVHVGGITVFYDHAGKLVPDVNVIPPQLDGAPVADRCVMFVDGDIGEAHAFLFTEEQAQELAQLILAPTVEVHRTLPADLRNGDGVT